MKTRIIIPARLKSSRFPEKLVQNINDISLIEHIILRAKKLPHYSITVATDDDKIKNLVEKHNINVWFSKKTYVNGTHRIAAMCRDLKFNSLHKDAIRCVPFRYLFFEYHTFIP